MFPRDSAPLSPFPLDPAVTKVLGPPSRNNLAPFRPNPPVVPPANPAAPVSVVWFRGHDLRIDDHAALDAAVASASTVVALYVLECGAETDGALRYMHSRRVSRQPIDDPSSNFPADSDTISAVTLLSAPPPPPGSHSDSDSPPAFGKQNTSRIPLESERNPWGPLSPNGGFALGRVQRWYLHHSLCALRKQLEQLGITLVLRRVDCADDTAPQVASVAKSLGAGSVFWNKRYKPRAYPVDEAVKSSLRKLGIYSQDFDSETLMEPSISLCGRYDDFQSYTRFWIDAMRACPPQRPNKPIHKSDIVAMERSRVHDLLAQGAANSLSVQSSTNCANKALPVVADLELLEGLSLEGLDSPGNVEAIGCVAARRAIKAFLQQDRFSRFASGRARRDGMVTGEDLATSRLSPHVRFGEVSPRVLFYEIVDAGAAAKDNGNDQGLEAACTFLKNMSLREFGYYMLTRYPSAAYKPIMPEFEAFPWEEDEEGALTHAWETGTTGFPIVDAAMRQLLREGWLHNRMRFLAASFFCKYLLLPWPVGAAHLVRTLVDGDEACNSLGWQWTVGCNSDSFPFSTLVNPLSLYTHTQSRKRAAEYVRRYVPELADLPDRLVFTPWKATEEERTTFRLSILPIHKYNQVCQEARYRRSGASQPVYYPARVVTGKDARFRARRAMEVMRRIFAAQRQVRTIIVEQDLPGTRAAHRKHPYTPTAEKTKKKARTIQGVHVLDADGNPVVDLDISDFSGSVSCVSDLKSTAQGSERRQRGTDEDESIVAPRKRRRTTKPSTDRQQEQPRKQSKTAKNRMRPMMSIAQLSSPPIDPNIGGLLHLAGQSTPTVTKEHTVSRAEAPRTTAGGMTAKGTAPKNAKRPRPVTPKIGPTTSERLSVKALLSPPLTHDVGVAAHSPSSLLQATGGSPVISHPHMHALPKLAPVASYQNPTSGNGNARSDPTTPDMLSNFPSYIRSSPPLPNERILPSTPSHRTPQLNGNHGIQANNFGHRSPNEGRVMPQPSGLGSHSPTSPFRYRGSPTHENLGAGQNVGRVSDVEAAVVGSAANVRVPGSHSHMKREMTGPMPPFDVHRAQGPTVFHPSVSPVPLIGSQYQHPQHHNPQMMVSFRPPPNNPMQVSHINHAPSAIPNPNASQGYFATSPISANPHQPGGQQVLWYPTLSPYVELRSPGLPGAVLPHMMHPIARQHPHGMPMGYPIPGTGAMGAQGDPSRMVPQAAMPVPFGDAEGSTRRGPNSPIEREAIARRMAAMDYHDENYGGKHFEQWQAIALHLLNQYEFSEDTDRETSRAYVRLCVLKDELRDANRNGPRVTVNHCKEVFRILNLPVTGEWDRRGHGGVRGPYVYGCVKKSGVQVSRR